MKMTQYCKSRLLILPALLCTLVLTACQHPAATATDIPDEQRVLNSFLVEVDLPEGWFRDFSDVELVENDKIYVVAFRATAQPGLEYIVVTQELIMYVSENDARSAYQGKWVQSSPSLVWGQTPTEISFNSEADEFKIGCLYSTTKLQPENVCTAVARYDRLVSILTTKIWDEDDKDQWFTWVDLEQVLAAMDRRALEAAGR